MSDKDKAVELSTQILANLPYNTNKAYAEIQLDKSDCTLYIPLRDKQIGQGIENAKKIKAVYQDLFNKAEL